MKIGVTGLNKGITAGLTTMVNVVGVAHCPAVGVKVPDPAVIGARTFGAIEAPAPLPGKIPEENIMVKPQLHTEFQT